MKHTASLMLAISMFASPIYAADVDGVDPKTLNWQTCGVCPATPSVNVNQATITLGTPGASESGSQARAYHSATALLPAAEAYKVTFEYDLSTWDSYNAPGTPNPPFNGGTGFWDSFSVSVSERPIWQVGLTDPLTITQLPGLGFLWGGSSFGDLNLQKTKGKKSVTLIGNVTKNNYLNFTLDTATLPSSDEAYPSWGMFKVSEILPTCNNVSMSVPLYKQCDSQWKEDKLDHTDLTMCSHGCAVTSLAMVLSYYGVATTPKQLNDWLTNYFHDANGNGVLDPEEATYGYTRSGDVNWYAVATYSGNAVTHKGRGSGFPALDAELCIRRPTILNVPGHFVVAKAKTTTGTSVEYAINDPGYSRDSLVSYNGTFQSMRKFGPPGSGSIVFYYPPEVELLVIDPLGRKAGTQNGVMFNEILGAFFETEMIESVVGGASQIATGVLDIPDPPEGFYQVYVSSESGLDFLVDIYRFNREERPQSLVTKEFVLSAGESVTFEVPYSSRAGDINGDGFTDEVDLQIIFDSLGTKLGSPGFNPVADINGDGKVDFSDYKAVLDEVPNADLDGDGVIDSQDSCLGSDTSTPLTIAGCDTKVDNTVFPDGCTLSDLINKCALNIRNHGDFVSCISHLTNTWLTDLVITGREKGRIQACSAKSKIK